MVMLRASIDTKELQTALGASRAQLTPALSRFFQRVAVLVERGGAKNLAGAGAPGSYPIPIRTGDLLRGQGSESSPRHAEIFNTAIHADAQQAGYFPYGNRALTPIPPRPFNRDAAKAAPIEDELADALMRVFP
jgi:hypothetical protein